jgi:hypothetical protein
VIDRKAAVWGAAIALAIVAFGIVRAFEFPSASLPVSLRHGAAIVASAALFLLVVASYRKLWRIRGFWGWLVALAALHWLLYWSFLVRAAEGFGGLQMCFAYGAAGAVEFAAFAIVMVRRYHRLPDTRSFSGYDTSEG